MLCIHPKPNPWHSPIPTSSASPYLQPRFLPPKTLNSTNPNAQKPQSQSSSGKIKFSVLTQQGRLKLNPNPDPDFYAFPRFVTHVDSNFISTLTNLYRERLSPGFEILDLMSSWVSHLPEEIEYGRVVGHGLNAQELLKNRRLDYFFVKDLNREQKLELESCSFDAVLCTVSVQYVQQPEKVFAEIFRVLRPGGVCIVSFSNRLFYEKAISAWRDGTAYSRTQLVLQYFQCVEGFTQPKIVRKCPATDQEDKSGFGWIARLLGGLFSGFDPFYAVIAYKNFKPVYE